MALGATNYFGVIDYITVGLTLVISLGIGIYHAVRGRGQQTNEDLLMGGRKMKAIPIAASMLVTYFSAIAIIGYPAEIYSNGIQIFWIHVLLTCICIPAAAYIFMSVLYKLKLTSVYEYFELRFESVAVRCFASGIFILQMSILTGVALFAPSIALEAFLGLPTWISIVGIGVIGTIYTSIGGLKAVVWTDVFQFVLIIVGMVTIVTRGFLTSGGIYEAFSKANKYGRLELFNWNVDPFERYNTVNFIVGYGIAIICFYGAHQPNVQRYSSLPTMREAIKAMAWNALFKEVTNIMIICTGVSLFATYAGCDPILLGDIKKADQIVPYFFIHELAWIPGMMGIFTSCIFSAVLSTLSSALNSLAAVTWQDFLSRVSYFDKMGEAAKGRVTCAIAAVYGIAAILMALVASNLGSIFQVTITVIGAFSGTLGACFLMGLFLPCVNKAGALIGMAMGLFSTGFLTVEALLLKQPYATLPTSLDECPANTNFTNAKNATIFQATTYEWPTKIWTISYILYPFIGTVITITFGIIGSYCFRCCIAKPSKSTRQYLHPLARSLCCLGEDDEEDDPPGLKKPQYSTKNYSNGMNKYQVNGNGIDNAAFEMKNV